MFIFAAVYIVKEINVVCLKRDVILKTQLVNLHPVAMLSFDTGDTKDNGVYGVV